MVYDCFTFFNELDLLEIRLNLLEDVVDRFVLVEMSKTHTGNQKPFYFDENKERFSKYLDKIIHIKITKTPILDNSKSDKYGNKWLLENFQRDCIMKGLSQAQDNDVIIISDLDEIPNPEVIKSYDCSGIWVLEQSMRYYFLNNICYTYPIWRNGTRIGLLKYLRNPQQQLPESEFYEFSKYGLPTYFRFCSGQCIPNAGWHFSYCGSLSQILNKRKSIVEQQFNTVSNLDLDYVSKAIKSGKDILGRKQYRYMALSIRKSLPYYIVKNEQKYAHMMLYKNYAYFIKSNILLYLFKMKKYTLAFIAKNLPSRSLRRKIKKYISPVQ